MSVQRDHRRDALLSLAHWVDGGADASAQPEGEVHAPSLAELLRRRGHDAASGGARAAAGVVAEPAAVLSVRPRMATPPRNEAPAARKGLLARLAVLLPGRRASRANHASLPAARAAGAPLGRVVDPVAARSSESRADAMAIQPGMDAAWRPEPSAADPLPQSVVPAAPYLHAMPHPAAPWMPASMPAPTSAHFYWPATPTSVPHPPHPALVAWRGDADPRPAGSPEFSADDDGRLDIHAEVDALRERLRDFAATVERLRVARRRR